MSLPTSIRDRKQRSVKTAGYHRLVDHYEACLQRHGDSHLGVDWPKAEDAQTRYRVMTELIPAAGKEAVTLLDFGCGAAHLLEYILNRGLCNIRYSGLDLSPRFVSLCRSKFPTTPFYCCDILQGSVELPQFDYVVLNGVLTEKRELSFEEMWRFTRELLKAVFPVARKGMAFNVMSKQVDWERDDLFHLPFDTLAEFLTKSLSSRFAFRRDYGLYEYTAYVYR